MTSYEAQNHIDDYYQSDQIQNESEPIQTSRSFNATERENLANDNRDNNNSTTGFMKYKTDEPLKPINSQRGGGQTNRSDITRNQNYQDVNPGKTLSLEYGKTIRLLRNGDEFYRGHKFVINSRKYKYFDVFMDDISNDLNANFGAIRKIHTPVHGHRIKSLDEMEDGKTYVAAGNSRFIKINYTDVLEGRRPAPNNRLPAIERTDYSNLVIRQYDTPQNALIFVYRNGDPNYPPAKILLYKSTLNSYDAVLDQISTRVKLANGAVFKLFTMEGELVKGSSDIISGESYVAAHKERFKKLDYFAGNHNGSPRYIRKTQMRKTNSQPSYASTSSSKTNSSFGNKYNGWRKENTNPAAMPNNNLPPVVRVGKARVTVNVDKDDSGLFKAKSQIKEKETPKTIDDDPTMFVDMPVDRKHAEQVDDEFLNEQKVIKNSELKPNSKQAPSNLQTPQPKDRSPSPIKNISTPPSPKPAPVTEDRSPSPSPAAVTKDSSPSPTQNQASEILPQLDTSRDDAALKLNVVSDHIDTTENNEKTNRTEENELNSARLSTARNEVIEEPIEVAPSLIQNEDMFTDEIVQNEQINEVTSEVAANQIITNELEDLNHLENQTKPDQSIEKEFTRNSEELLKPSSIKNTSDPSNEIKEEEDLKTFQIEQVGEEEIKSETKQENISI